MTLVADNTAQDMDFHLPDIVDQEMVPKVRRGKYFINCFSQTNPLIDAESSDFRVSLISVARLKKDYLHGTTQRASETLAVHNQPVDITGVEVTNVSNNHPQSWITLSYNYSEDGGNTVQALSWCAGPLVVLSPTRKRYTLRKGSSSDYIDIKIDFASLPTSSITEEILVEKAPLEEERMRAIIDQKISWLEDSELSVFLEPTRIITDFNSVTEAGSIAYGSGTDIPTFVNSDFDEIRDAVTYFRASAGAWINFKMPYYPLIRFNELYGKVSNTRIVDIALEWVEANEKGGFVELVPFNQEIAFNFIGLIWVESLRGPVPIPNFWNYDAIVGFRETPEVLIELVAKKAAIDILTIAGQAFRGGFSSQSISRDGISESVSYTASATFGIYSATIEDYRKWVEMNLVKLKGAFRGSSMVVL